MKTALSSPRFTSLLAQSLLLVSTFLVPLELAATQLPNPTITASARPYNADYAAVNLFDSGLAEYATAGQGAVSAPFTTDANNGTWVHFDFGTTVTFDRFVMSARRNGADVVGTSRLIVSSDPTFDNSDTIFTFNPSGVNGAGIIRNLGSVSGRYVRWEVLTSGGSSQN